jgi:Histidine kinase
MNETIENRFLTSLIWRGSKRYWLFQAVGWGGIALLTVSVLLVFGQRSTLDLSSSSPTQGKADAIFTLLTSLSGVICTHLLRALMQWQMWQSWSLRKVASHAVAWWLIVSGINSTLGALFYVSPAMNESASSTFIHCTMMNLSLFGTWMALYFLVHFNDALHQAKLKHITLSALNTENALLALQAQMNPHFIFNCLNTIRALTPVEATEARDAITLLADILRSTLKEGTKKLVPFAGELEITRGYLSMEKLRFDDTLLITENISPTSNDAKIPPLLLLTLVENAMKHGLYHSYSDGKLSITAIVENHVLIVYVIAPGSLIRSANQSFQESFGIGLCNSRERLELIFGPNASITLTEKNGHVESKLIIPQS